MYRLGALRASCLSPLRRGPLLPGAGARQAPSIALCGRSWSPEAGPERDWATDSDKKHFSSLVERRNVTFSSVARTETGAWVQMLQRDMLGLRSVHISSPMLRGEHSEEGEDAEAQCARNARSERGLRKAKEKTSEKRVTTTAAEGPAATATYGIIALVVGVFVVAMAANVANGYLRPDGQFWLYHRTLRTLKKDEHLLSIMGGSIRGVHSRRTSNSRVNLLQCANFVDDDGVKRCRLKFYVVPSNTGLDDAGVVFVEYDVSRYGLPSQPSTPSAVCG